MSIRDQLQYSNTPAWPVHKGGVKGDVLSGTVVARTSYNSDYGVVDVMVVLPDEPPTVGGKESFPIRLDGEEVAYESGALAFHGIGTVAKRFFEENDPQPGDEVAVLFDGPRLVQEGKFKGKEYSSWTFAHRKASVPTSAAPAPAVDLGDDDEEPF